MAKRGVVMLLCALLLTPFVLAKTFEWEHWEHLHHEGEGEFNLNYETSVSAAVATTGGGSRYNYRRADVALYSGDELKASATVQINCDKGSLRILEKNCPCEKDGNLHFSQTISAFANKLKAWGSVVLLKADFNRQKLTGSVTREDKDKRIYSLGKISSLDEAEFVVRSLDPQVKVWLSGNDVYACLDTNNDTRCDWEQAAVCEGDWWAGKCCGSAPYGECKFYPTVGVCGKNATNHWEWAAKDDIGKVHVLSSCPGITLFYSKGGQVSGESCDALGRCVSWTYPASEGYYYCGAGNESFAKEINATLLKQSEKFFSEGHEFWCVGSSIYECAGDKPAYNEPGQGGFTSGGSLVVNGTTYYCDGNGKFTTSIRTRSGCENAGLTWTGTKCCGELSDTERYYQDPFTIGVSHGSPGGCYNNTFIPSGSSIPDWPDIINYFGEFYICDKNMPENTSTKVSIKPPRYASLPFTPAKTFGPCGTPLFNATFAALERHIICFPNGEWKATSFEEFLRIKSTAWAIGTEPSKGCCPDNKCWNGTGCQSTGTYYKIDEAGYKCVPES